MNTTTDSADQHDLSENAWQARMMALPLVAWQDGVYRIVLWYDESDDEIRRTPERLTGHDLLGNERWEPLDNASIQWQYLAHQLAVTAAPWPAQAEAHQAGERAGRFALGAVADEHLRNAYTSLFWAYRHSEDNAVDSHILTAQEALEACAQALGLDPLKGRVSDALIALIDGDKQTPPVWPPVHQAVVDALIETAVEVIRVRDNFDSDWGQTTIKLQLAVLDKVARAAGIANLEERATEALRRTQQENAP
jgi:hypothetical protein